MAGRKLEYLGEPTLGQVMRRPQWLAALLLAMIIAAVFAWLGQWQMGNAIRDNVDELSATETVRPIDDLTPPIAGIPELSAGAVVSVDGGFVSGDFSVISERMNQGPDATAERSKGAWVVGHLVRPDHDNASLAVAVGWAPSDEAAANAVQHLNTLPEGERVLEGRYLPAEAPEVPRPDGDPHYSRTMVPAFLANSWNAAPTGPIYGGYLVLHETADAPDLADAGLVRIDSVAPSAPEKVSWLNVFYGIEWAVFAAVALFLWYRLARDAWEKEHEMMLLTAEADEQAAAEAAAEAAAGETETTIKP
ncbi:SURF1 family cytochrome oxidase biogenesis protein [Leucobacter komagatae]|uniref:SURF1 family cytochrome oxidase biogenesis protein n=1 Tax=Leucobacter komagatae TaxID=55969 RepID=UPI0005ABE9A1|nr:SURF1 family cytochrome oxidase biogenesis protein [Leucobacter komagatae]